MFVGSFCDYIEMILFEEIIGHKPILPQSFFLALQSQRLILRLAYSRDVNEYSNVRIFAFHTNIRMRFLDSNIRIIF